MTLPLQFSSSFKGHNLSHPESRLPSAPSLLHSFPILLLKQGENSSHISPPQATPSEDPTPGTSALSLLQGHQRPTSSFPSRPHLEETSWRRSGPSRAGSLYKPALRHSRRVTSLTPIGPRSQPRPLRLPEPSPSASATAPV